MNVGPVPGGSAADRPARFGQDATGSPHVHGGALHAENKCRASDQPTLNSEAKNRAACWGCGRYIRVNPDGTFKAHSRFGRDRLA